VSRYVDNSGKSGARFCAWSHAALRLVMQDADSVRPFSLPIVRPGQMPSEHIRWPLVPLAQTSGTTARWVHSRQLMRDDGRTSWGSPQEHLVDLLDAKRRHCLDRYRILVLPQH
jgi:hypothetical protein